MVDTRAYIVLRSGERIGTVDNYDDLTTKLRLGKVGIDGYMVSGYIVAIRSATLKEVMVAIAAIDTVESA